MTSAKFGTSVFTNHPSAIMFINGVKCRVDVEIKFADGGMPVDANIQIEAVNASEPMKSNAVARRNTFYKFGGWPDFIQNPCEPVAEDGTPYTYICTVNNNWGDCGNGNVFALIRDGFKVEDVYVEASCC